MLLHTDPLLHIYFGDGKASFERELLMSDGSLESHIITGELARVKKMMHLNCLVLLKQTHSSQGVCVSADCIDDLLIKKQEGDYLITQLNNTGLAVYTADCLPIIFYDTYNRVIAITHAGWQGSVDNIAVKTLQSLIDTYDTKPDHLRIFFGPSAKVCCYEVTTEFYDKMSEFEFRDTLFISHGNKQYFDLPLLNRLQLETFGIKKDAFHSQYNLCTICNPSFCSNRRDNQSKLRQLTVVSLK